MKLPDGIECWHCILQWTYVTGNRYEGSLHLKVFLYRVPYLAFIIHVIIRWGIGPQTAEFATQDCIDDEEGKLGCGQQETFRGCADICIGLG